jgi:DNA-directed RNA polymerase specialized sigma24 family protein
MDGTARELEALYETRYVSFRNALATVTGSRESARDAVQEAFARALAAPARERDEAHLAAYVWKIALRVALEQRRTTSRPPNGHDLDPQLLESERDPELAAALRELSPTPAPDRLAAVLRRLLVRGDRSGLRGQ